MATGTIHFEDRLRIPSDVFDLEGYTCWLRSDQFPDRGRVAFLDGEIHVDMSPEDLFKHNLVKTEVLAVVRTILRKSRSGIVFGDRSLVVNESARLSTEPDLTYVSYESFSSDKVRAEEWTEGSDKYMQLTGSPDMVLEVVSDSSVRKDKVVLPKLYARSHVREFWRVDARGTKILFEILQLRKGKYATTVSDARGWARSAVFDLEFRFACEDDPVAGLSYSLEHRRIGKR